MGVYNHDADSGFVTSPCHQQKDKHIVVCLINYKIYIIGVIFNIMSQAQPKLTIGDNNILHFGTPSM